MIYINLLPHRAEARRDRRNQTYAFLGISVVLGAALIFLAYGFIAQLVSSQEEKNVFLKNEIAKLDKDIDEIRKLKEQIQALLARKQVIESLQANRSESVNLFNELAKQTPEGVYLRKIVQKDTLISLTGTAESDSRVAAFYKSLEASPFLQNPKVLEIKAGQVGTRTVKDFQMEVSIVRRVTEDKDKKGGQKKPAQKAA